MSASPKPSIERIRVAKKRIAMNTRYTILPPTMVMVLRMLRISFSGMLK
jgi:hypothetical protein